MPKKAQIRLCGRFRRLMARGKQRNKVVTAIARELAGFMWAIAREVLRVWRIKHIIKEQKVKFLVRSV